MRISFTCILTLSCFLFSGTACSSGPAREESAANNSASAGQTAGDTDANQALADGTKLLEEGETDRAIGALLKAVEIDPELADAYFQLGIAYSLLEKRDAAVVNANIDSQADSPQPKNPKETKTNSEISFEKAVAAYKKILSANVEDAAAHYNLGRAYNKLNRDEDAARSLRQAVKLNPDDTEYQTELGAIFIKLARYHEAIAPLTRALELDPANSRAEGLLSDAEAGSKRVDYSAPKKGDKKDPQAMNSNTDANSVIPAANTTPKPIPTKPVKPAFPTNRSR